MKALEMEPLSTIVASAATQTSEVGMMSCSDWLRRADGNSNNRHYWFIAESIDRSAAILLDVRLIVLWSSADATLPTFGMIIHDH
jgi:hypothetical protein